MKRNLKHIFRAGTVVLAMMAIAGLASAQSGRTMRVDKSGRVPNQARNVHSGHKNQQQMEAVRLEGEVSISSKGLQIGRELVRILPATSIYPRPRDLNRMPDLSRYRGEHATVFGRRGPDGIEATVVLFRSDREGVMSRNNQKPYDRDYREPVTPRTGSLSRDVPQ